MKITETVHAIKHPFRLALGEGQYAERSVYSYLLAGDRICLIDTGVSSTSPVLQGYLKEIGRSPDEISLVLITHSHPDHIGGCKTIKRISPASFGAHAAEKPWIEDVERQYRERPILNFFELVEGSVPVDLDLKEGETVSWEKGKGIRVLETPGHAKGALAFLFEKEGVLFSGDAIPSVGAIPVYIDPRTSIKSIQKLQKLSGVTYLLSSWHEPITGGQISTAMEEGIRYIERIDKIVGELSRTMPSETSSEEFSLRALEKLGIKVPRVPLIVRTSFESHRKK
jgi:glyoxylase-like metal-dependent hydrolase (beta-lactamase superfamily II)